VYCSSEKTQPLFVLNRVCWKTFSADPI